MTELFGRQVRSRTASPANQFNDESLSKYPKFVVPMTDNTSVRLHARAELKSRIEPRGDPNLAIEWLKDDVPVRTNRRVTSYFNYGYAALIITGFEEKDGGRYTCIATNSHGTDRVEASLQLDGRYRRSRQGEEKSREEAIKRLLRLKEAMKQADKADENRKAEYAARMRREAEIEAEKRRLAELARRDARVEEARRRADEAQVKAEAETRAKAAAAAEARRILDECGALRRQRQQQNQQYLYQQGQQQQQQWSGSMQWRGASEASSRTSSALSQTTSPRYIWIPYRELEDSIIYKRELTMYETIREFEDASSNADQTMQGEQSSELSTVAASAKISSNEQQADVDQQVRRFHELSGFHLAGDSAEAVPMHRSQGALSASHRSQGQGIEYLQQQQSRLQKQQSMHQQQERQQLMNQQQQLTQQRQQQYNNQHISAQAKGGAEKNVRANDDDEKFDYYIRVPYRVTEDSIFYRREREIYETVIEYEDDKSKQHQDDSSRAQSRATSQQHIPLYSSDHQSKKPEEKSQRQTAAAVQRRLRGGDVVVASSNKLSGSEATRAIADSAKIREARREEDSKIEAGKSGELRQVRVVQQRTAGREELETIFGQQAALAAIADDLETQQKVANEMSAIAQNELASNKSESVALRGAEYYIRIPYRELEDSIFLKRERTIYETVVEYETIKPAGSGVTETIKTETTDDMVKGVTIELEQSAVSTEIAQKSAIPRPHSSGLVAGRKAVIANIRGSTLRTDESDDEDDEPQTGISQRVSLTIELSEPSIDQYARPRTDGSKISRHTETTSPSELDEAEAILDVTTEKYMIEILEPRQASLEKVELSSPRGEENFEQTDEAVGQNIKSIIDMSRLDTSTSKEKITDVTGPTTREERKQGDRLAPMTTQTKREEPVIEPRRLLTASDLEERALRRRLRGGDGMITPTSISRTASPTPSYIPRSYQRLSVSPLPRTTSYGEGKYSSERFSYLTNPQRSRSISPYITGRRSASPRPASASSSYIRRSA